MIPKKEGTVTITLDGKEYSGNYNVDRGLLTVSCQYGTEKAQLTSGSNPEPWARIMLTNIIKKAPKK